jgi:YVTN family beta-propeller protein
MRWFRWVRGVVVFGLAGALVGVGSGGVPASAARARCRSTAFVTNSGGGTVSTIDVKTRAKNPNDIAVGSIPTWVAFTPDGETAFVTNNGSGTVSTIDVKTRTKHPGDIRVGQSPVAVAVTPCRR